MGFAIYSDYISTISIHSDSPGVYTSDNIFDLGTIDEIQLKCDVLDGIVVNGSKQPILYSFVLDKPAGYKVFSQLKRVIIKKISKWVLNTITLYLEDVNHEDSNFNGETLTFTLQKIKIWSINWAFKSTNVTLIVLEEDIDLLQQIFIVIQPLKEAKY